MNNGRVEVMNFVGVPHEAAEETGTASQRTTCLRPALVLAKLSSAWIMPTDCWSQGS